MNKKKKKLLFLINTLEGGGAEKVLCDTVNALDKSQFDVTVMTVIDGGAFRQNLNDNIHYKSIVKCKNSFFRRVMIYLVCFILPPKLIHKKFIGGGYDYETAFLEGVPTKLIAASGNNNSIKYAWVHIDLYNTFGLDKVHRSFKKHIECYRKFDKIICVSQTVREAFLKRFGEFSNTEVKYNFINADDIKKRATEEKAVNDRLRIVAVGRLEMQKGFDRLLRIFNRLVKEGHDCELRIVGEGSMHTELEEYIRSCGLSNRVELTGFVDNPYIYMKNADILVFPSRAEGYSTVATEAVILGKPIVVSDCSGMREIFGNSEYGIVTENNEEALYNGIRSLVVDSSLRSSYTKKAALRGEKFCGKLGIKQIEDLFC